MASGAGLELSSRKHRTYTPRGVAELRPSSVMPKASGVVETYRALPEDSMDDMLSRSVFALLRLHHRRDLLPVSQRRRAAWIDGVDNAMLLVGMYRKASTVGTASTHAATAVM